MAALGLWNHSLGQHFLITGEPCQYIQDTLWFFTMYNPQGCTRLYKNNTWHSGKSLAAHKIKCLVLETSQHVFYSANRNWGDLYIYVQAWQTFSHMFIPSSRHQELSCSDPSQVLCSNSFEIKKCKMKRLFMYFFFTGKAFKLGFS